MYSRSSCNASTSLPDVGSCRDLIQRWWISDHCIQSSSKGKGKHFLGKWSWKLVLIPKVVQLWGSLLDSSVHICTMYVPGYCRQGQEDRSTMGLHAMHPSYRVFGQTFEAGNCSSACLDDHSWQLSRSGEERESSMIWRGGEMGLQKMCWWICLYRPNSKYSCDELKPEMVFSKPWLLWQINSVICFKWQILQTLSGASYKMWNK